MIIPLSHHCFNFLETIPSKSHHHISNWARFIPQKSSLPTVLETNAPLEFFSKNATSCRIKASTGEVIS